MVILYYVLRLCTHTGTRTLNLKVRSLARYPLRYTGLKGASPLTPSICGASPTTYIRGGVQGGSATFFSSAGVEPAT